MKLFGRRGREHEPPVDVALGERLGEIEGPATAEAALTREPIGRPGAPEEPAPSAGAASPSASVPSAPDPPALEPEPAPGPSAAASAPGPRPAPDAGAVPVPDPHVDSLTDLLGPAIFERLLVAESARSRRYRRPATLVLAELAGMDELVRAWGPDVATRTVVALATILRTTSRTSDHVARIDAHRFGVVLTETDEIAAINYVDRVREAWTAEQAIAAGAMRVGIGWAGTPGRATLLDARSDAEERLRDDLA